MTPSADNHEDAALKIGAVARLTGLSVHTLRKWEDRYGAVAPQRSEGGERIYTRTDLKRLAYIKRLADAGFSLREVAGKSLQELANAWQEASGMHMPEPYATSPEKMRIAILGDVLPALLERRDTTNILFDMVASSDSEQRLIRILGDESIDILVYECPTVHRDTRARVAELKRTFSAHGVIVVYGFGAHGDVSALQRPDVAVMRAPADIDALIRVARNLRQAAPAGLQAWREETSLSTEDAVPPPILSRETIVRVAMSAPKMRCECPHHLADIVLSLRAFEEYSEECESQNDDDAELHHFLWLCAARARVHFEDAIIRVAEVEGISLEES